MYKFITTITFLFSLSILLTAQTCYQNMLAKAKQSMEDKNYRRTVNIIESIIESCEDIPSNNPLESIKRTALAFDSIDNAAKLAQVVKMDSVKPVLISTQEEKMFVNQIRKSYGLTETDMLKTKPVEFDFNNDGLQDIAILFYFEKKINSKIKNQLKFMSIAVFERTPKSIFVYKNRADNNNLLVGDCNSLLKGIENIQQFEKGIFVFGTPDKKCSVKYKYNPKNSKIEILK